MEKGCQSSGDSVASGHYLKQLNKLSHKISKPPIAASHPAIRKSPLLDQSSQSSHVVSSQPQPLSQSHPLPLPVPPGQPPHQPQPPVYNINKNDFRDVVQKLTGSPAHSAPPGAPPSQPPPLLQSSKQTSLRMQRIRPPPLEHVGARPPGLLSTRDPLQFFYPTVPNPNSIRPPSSAPLSPLPPLPTVHAAAESPISAYMRYIKGSAPSNFPEQNKLLSPLGFSSPRWNNLFSSSSSSQQQPNSTVDQSGPSAGGHPQLPFPQMPPFSCMSPLSTAAAYAASFPLLSPSALPLSPTVPAPSPKWRGV